MERMQGRAIIRVGCNPDPKGNLRLKWKDRETGKYKTASTGTKDRAEAEKLRVAKEVEINNPDKSMTVYRLFEFYFAWVREENIKGNRVRSKATIDTLECFGVTLKRNDLGAKLAAGVAGEDVTAYLAAKVLAPATQRKRLATFRLIWKWARTKRSIPLKDFPVLDMETDLGAHAKEARHEHGKAPIPARIIRSLLELLEHDSVGSTLRLILVTGARSGEARAVAVRDVSFVDGIAWVKLRGKTGRTRSVPVVDKRLVELFNRRAMTAINVRDPLFPGRFGGPVSSPALRHRLKAHLASLGEDQVADMQADRQLACHVFDVHGLRRAFIDQIRSVGVGEVVQKAITGHRLTKDVAMSYCRNGSREHYLVWAVRLLEWERGGRETECPTRPALLSDSDNSDDFAYSEAS